MPDKIAAAGFPAVSVTKPCDANRNVVDTDVPSVVLVFSTCESCWLRSTRTVCSPQTKLPSAGSVLLSTLPPES